MKRTVVYSPEGASLDVVLALQARAQRAGFEVTECAAGCSWDEVRSSLNRGDSLVVDSLLCFHSLNDLLGFVASSGVFVHSLDEAWFSEPFVDPMAYQTHLYELGSSLHANRTRQGLAEAAANGRKPGRRLGSIQPIKQHERDAVTRVDALRMQERVSVAEGCRQVGISPYIYYRTRKTMIQG